ETRKHARGVPLVTGRFLVQPPSTARNHCWQPRPVRALTEHTFALGKRAARAALRETRFSRGKTSHLFMAIIPASPRWPRSPSVSEGTLLELSSPRAREASNGSTRMVNGLR